MEAQLDKTAVDVVIVTYNRYDKIDAAIRSVRQSTHHNFTLWVLDKSDQNTVAEIVAAHMAEDPRVRYRRVPLQSLAATRNSAAQFCDAQYLCFINDDCQVEPAWIRSLLTELRDPLTWTVFGRVLSGAREDARDGPRRGGLLKTALKTSTRRQVYQDQRYELAMGHGHNMAVRRERLLALGGFDELLGSGARFGSWEDIDWTYRVMLFGGRVVYTPDAVSYHCHPQEWALVQTSYAAYGLGAGAAVGKYLRCGDYMALRMLVRWLVQQGLRLILSGIIKRRSLHRVIIGLTQLVYPFLGLLRGFEQPIDPRRRLYLSVTPAEACSNTGA